ncbi:hypothetical protein [Aeoliella sp.]|uniref:hypothetical protein n=1 Tax=Aeoliella sp. TaxID=2795800 RepID=UPI003CCC0FB3
MAEQREAIIRFDIRTILALMAFAAIAAAGIASATQGWSYVFDSLLVLLLGGSLVASAFCIGSRRAFWFALFVFTLLYLLATHNSLKPLGIRGLPTNTWIRNTMNRLHPAITHVENRSRRGVPYKATVIEPNPKAYVGSQIGYKSMAIVVGLIAAYISRALYVIAQRRVEATSD